MAKYVKIYTDGGARGNPGPAGISAVLEYNGQVKKYKKYIGHATNNEAEYQAVIFALEKAKELGAKNVDVFLDSELVANQLSQKFKIKDKKLALLFVKVWNISIVFDKIKYIHIYREDNKEADRLVNQAIDKAIR